MTVRRVIALFGLLAILGTGRPATGQPAVPTPAPLPTVLTNPSGLSLHLTGDMEISGPSPLELPYSAGGRFSMIAQGNGVARTQGVFRFEEGLPPRSLSEPSGLSAGLVVRSLNYPGVPHIASKRPERGWPMVLAASGALGMATAAHLQLEDDLDTPGTIAGFDIREERHERNAWLIYGGAVWGMSAIDYWMRPRFTTHVVSTEKISVMVPTLNRGKVVGRSMFVPGAGQTYANHRTRGALWLLGVLAAGAGYAVGETMVASAQHDIDENLYLAGQNPADSLLYLGRVKAANDDLASAEDLRRDFGYGAIGVYALNVLDAMMLSLHQKTETEPLPLSATFGPDGTRIAVRFRY
ncbi:MAG TPA: hypothetical protein VGQ14_04105 [Candidatus Eisenbacteria bacterium]|jgi:hypothetical protein|nr:hypothetical protein [Candidatus Eisenbacteria bacterium]